MRLHELSRTEAGLHIVHKMLIAGLCQLFQCWEKEGHWLDL